MDMQAVLDKALALGCQIVDDGKGDHRKLFTPSGKMIPIRRSSNVAGKGISDRAFQLMKRLREGGVDVKRGRSAGPARRVDGGSLLCKERRCGNLACPRNSIALVDLPASGKAFATFRSKSCGFIQVVGCGQVIRRGVDPELCGLPSKHEGLCGPAKAKEPEVIAVPTSAVEPAAASAPSPQKQRKTRTNLPDEQKAAAVARVRAGAQIKDVAAELGVSPSAVSTWCRIAGYNARAKAQAPVARPAAQPALPAPVPPPVVHTAHVVTVPAPAEEPQTLFAVDPPMLAVVQVGEETYDLAIPASELVKLVLKYRVSQ